MCTENVGDVYLIHLSEKFHHAQHYIGFSSNVERRSKSHRKQTGSRFLRAVTQNGIDFTICRVWSNKCRKFERLLKNQKNTARICPMCNPKAIIGGLIDAKPKRKKVKTEPAKAAAVRTEVRDPKAQVDES